MCGKMGGTWRSRRAGAVAVGTVVPVVARTSGGMVNMRATAAPLRQEHLLLFLSNLG